MKLGQGIYQSGRCVVHETGTGDISEWQVCCAGNWDRGKIRVVGELCMKLGQGTYQSVRCVVHETGIGDISESQVCCS